MQELRELGGIERRIDRGREQRLDLVEQEAAVAIGARDQRRLGIVGDGQGASDFGFGALDQRCQRFPAQAVQHQHLRPRQQRGVQREAGVLGRRADEHHRAAFDIGQEAVLLGAIETVDLVDEKQGALARRRHLLGIGEGLPEVGDAREDRRQWRKAHTDGFGEQPRDRRLAGARRAPEDDRRQLARRDHAADRAFGAGQMFLPDDIGERAGAQSLGERHGSGGGAFALRRCILAEQIPGHRTLSSGAAVSGGSGGYRCRRPPG